MRRILAPPQIDLEQMRADAVLPADVEPAGPAHEAPAATVLLTGSTGFVGAHLLHALLRDTPAVVVCLVRRGNGAERIRHNLQSHGLWEPGLMERIRPVEGDLRLPGLGLSEPQQQALADGVDAIYHGGAAVNWIHRYDRLHSVNVGGTLELLRLACRTRAKPFHFLSTIGVCYGTGATARTMTENDDPEPLLGHLHLGYAQSKSVAESLVRQAQTRGLPAVVYRPTLITGDSRTGAANPDDFLARGIGACVRMGCAPDVDWSIEAIPVDYVARVVVRHGMLPRRSDSVLHLMHPQPRQWRELVLWMRLFGYPLELRPYAEWLACLEHTAREPRHPLRPLLGFFRARAAGVSLPETYLDGRRNRVCAKRTCAALTELDLDCPPLDARWLERFFASLAAHGVVPSNRRTHADGEKVHRLPSGTASHVDDLTGMLRRHFDDPGLLVQTAGPAQRLSHQSILTELTAWRCGPTVGLFRQPLQLSSRRAGVPARLEVVVKVKTDDRHLLDVVEAAAALCNRRVGAAFARRRDQLGLAGGHLREIALYSQTDERWRRLTPICYGTAWDDERQRGSVVMESLGPGVWMDPCTETNAWHPAQIEATIRGLAELHAIWFDGQPETAWLGPIWSAARMAEMIDLWSALAAHAARVFVPWLGTEVRRIQRRLLARLEQWWRPLNEMPRTLIHNDFNPRNLALRPGPVLCAFDWELATWGVPQHDLAQLLCFVLPFDCSRETLWHYLDLHRRSLEEATDRPLDPDDWRRGFGLALADLLVNRWAMFTLVHAIRPQRFLPRVLQTWQTLYTYSEALD
jgi:thioester reductase-like protein